MKKIKDRLVLGLISGIIAGIPGQLLNILEHKQKLTDVPYSQVASEIFFDKSGSKEIPGQILSVVVNSINTGFAGIVTTYTLSTTGKDNAIIKGIAVWSLSWVLVAGLLSKTVLKVKSENHYSPIFSLADHIVMGCISSYLITKLGDDSLFPNKDINKQEKVPVLYTGNHDHP